MANIIIVSINEFCYEWSDLANINKTAFTISKSLCKLNNTYYLYWKDLVKANLKGQFMNILDELTTISLDILNNEIAIRK